MIVRSNPAAWLRAAVLAWTSLIGSLTTQAAIVVNDFDDIQLWTGNGANQAALVVDWADGRSPLVWGYRFDTASGQDMIRDVVSADSRLFAKVQDFGGTLGWFVHGLGYDRDADGFQVAGTNFGANGLLVGNTIAVNGVPAGDIDDSYFETDSAFNSFVYWNGAGNDYPGAAGWGVANSGPSSRGLANNAWDGFQFNTLGFANALPPATAFAAVPEPSGVWCIGLLVSGLALRRTNVCWLR